MRLKYSLLLFLMFAIAATALAQDVVVKRSEQKSLVGIQVHFRLDKHNLDMEYMGNDASLHDFAHKIDSLGIERIDSVVIISQSSPEGVYEHNLRLSERRAATMSKYISENHPELSHKVFVHPDGESWLQLREYVLHDTKMKKATIEKVLAVIDSDVNIGTKKWRMSKLPVYRYLLATYYPKIRNSMFCILYYNEIPVPKPEPEPVPEPEPTYPEVPKIPVPSLHKENATVVAVKTNMLYDVVTALNVEVEIPIGKRWSVAVEDVFPWWHYGNKYAFQMWEMGVEGRYWFKRTDARDVLSGHFGGVYVMSAKYDFQWKSDINYQGEYWSAGITYGYSMPLGKYFNLELSASIGYLSTYYRHYYPTIGYGALMRDYDKQGRLGYFGPTKLKASLVLPIQMPVKTREEVRYE